MVANIAFSFYCAPVAIWLLICSQYFKNLYIYIDFLTNFDTYKLRYERFI